MLVFNTAFSGAVKDHYGTWDFSRADSLNAYKVSSIERPSGSNKNWTFTAYRSPESTDTFYGKDFKIPCGGGSSEYGWMVKPSNVKGSWNFETKSDCTVVEEAAPKTPSDKPADTTTTTPTEEPTGAKSLTFAATSMVLGALISSVY